MTFGIGDTVGAYRIISVIGSGGMGRVFKVEQTVTGRIEAMKVLFGGRPDTPDLAQRFLREIQVQARLNHPNIAAVHNAFWAGDDLVMVMELVEGESLRHRLERGRLPLGLAIHYARQALLALGFAHKQGVTHRDITPANILLTPAGIVKLTDFGLARAPADPRLSQPGVIVGSLPYMSPEQVRGLPTLDARADLYSLGVVLYEMVTGRKPFESDNAFALMVAQVEQAPAPPIDADPSVPPALNDLILAALAKDPAQRFQNADQFRRCLERVLSGPRRSGAPLLRRLQLGSALTALVLVSFAAGVWRKPVVPTPPSPKTAAVMLAPTASTKAPPVSPHRARQTAPPPAPKPVALVPPTPAAPLPEHTESHPKSTEPPVERPSSPFELVRTLNAGGTVWTVAFSPDGRWLAGGTDNTLEVWDAVNGQRYASLPGHSARVAAVTFSSNGASVASGSRDRTVKVWDLGAKTERKTLRQSSPVNALALSRDGRWLAVGTSDKKVTVWNLDSGKCFHELHEHKREPQALAFSPDGQLLATVSSDKILTLWAVAEDRVRLKLVGPELGATAVAFSPDGRFVAAAGLSRLKVWEVETGREVQSQEAPGWLHALTFTGKGRWLDLSATPDAVRLWDGKTSAVREDKAVQSLALSPDGRRLATASTSGALRLFRR